MFVRVKKIGACEYLYLVENAREGGRHVQHVIKALGRRDEVEASGLLDGLIAAAARHSRRSIVLSSFYRGALPALHRLSIGADLVFGRLWAETGCRDVLSRVRVPGAAGLDRDHAYKAMAWLGEVDATGRSTAEAVEEALYRHRQPLFGAVSIAFVETTTLWFKGAGGESLGQYGHSKDDRSHLKQVVLGIVLDDADRPIASFLMPGNTADVTLLLPVVTRLRERFGILEACIVADHGMISADTITALEAEKIQYILGARERTSREVRTAVIEDDGLAVPLLIPRQKGETELAIREMTLAGRRYVMCRNEEEAKKDAAARAELVAGLERKLAQGDKALVANKGFRRFLKTPKGDGFVIDRAKVEADARFDGLFVLRTNTKITALQVVLRYRNLLTVEDAFKTAKALLATRPIFHKTDAGIRGYVFCTFLALVLRKELIDRLAARRSKLEWQRIVDDLTDLSEIDVEQDGRRARLRTASGPTIDPICRAIGLTLPPVFQEMPPAP
jgi:Transposase DDE domain